MVSATHTAASSEARSASSWLDHRLTDRTVPSPAGALRAWHEVGAPDEAARARLGLGRALKAVGDAHAAALELSAANVTFERLGALLDKSIVEDLLATR